MYLLYAHKYILGVAKLYVMNVKKHFFEDESE